MKQVKKAGIKEFFLALLIIFLIMTICGYIKFITPTYTVFVDILTVVLFVIYGFKVLTHYGADFTYTLTDTTIKINRTIGKRNKETEIPYSCVVSVSKNRPDTKYIKNFSPYITGGKNIYITYDAGRLKEVVCIAADNEITDFLNKHTTGRN